MNWNFIIRLFLVLGMLVYLIFANLALILSVIATSISMTMVIPLIFVLLIFGIYKFLRAGWKIDKKNH